MALKIKCEGKTTKCWKKCPSEYLFNFEVKKDILSTKTEEE